MASGLNKISEMFRNDGNARASSRGPMKDIQQELNGYGIRKSLETQKQTAKTLLKETISGEKGGPLASLKNQIGRNIDLRA